MTILHLQAELHEKMWGGNALKTLIIKSRVITLGRLGQLLPIAMDNLL